MKTPDKQKKHTKAYATYAQTDYTRQETESGVPMPGPSDIERAKHTTDANEK